MLLGIAAGLVSCASTDQDRPLVGAVFLVHGGFDDSNDANLWDSTLQIFSYDPNNFVYQRVIWTPQAWPMILRAGNAPKERGKYAFEMERIGGHDPAMDLSRAQLADMSARLEDMEDELGVRFVTDYGNWIGDIKHMAHPRGIYNPPTDKGTPVTYCGDPGGEWADCDPERYNTDGTIERMLKAGVEDIIVIDLTTSGVRFFKSNDFIRTAREVIAAHNTANATDVRLHWLNDPTDLMLDSYPDQPAGWTASAGMPENDPKVPLADRPNPVSSDPAFALLHAEGIEAHFNDSVSAANTGIMLINHATRAHNQLFDPEDRRHPDPELQYS